VQRLDRLERVTDLLLVLLDTSHPLSLREIADRVPGYPDTQGARRQAFERDKRLLRDEGIPVLVIPIDGQDQLGYRIEPDSYYLPDLGLEPEEQAALNLAVAGVHLGEPIGRDALLKLGASGESIVRTEAAPLVDLRSIDGLQALPLLFDAIRQRSAVRFDYRGEERHVDMAGLRFRNGYWYAIGFDRGREEARTFRVDRIATPPQLGEPDSAEVPPGFDVDHAFSRDPWQFGEGDPFEVQVLVDAAEAGRVVTELGDEAVADRRSDGGVVVRLSVTDPEAVVLWVLDLLDHAEVLSPESVRTAVIDRLESIATGAAGGGAAS
jgi:predicted DNA-binding transcriptional regulator YafY